MFKPAAKNNTLFYYLCYFHTNLVCSWPLSFPALSPNAYKFAFYVVENYHGFRKKNYNFMYSEAL